MSEGRKDLIKELETKQAEHRMKYDTAKREADREAATYHEEMVSALDTALFALKEKENNV